MPNIKSAKKRVLVNQKKNAQNRSVKSQINTAVKKFKDAASKNAPETEVLYREAVSVIDSAASKNVIHKNSAARKKANIAKLMPKA